jgi:hypothetical protein
MARGRVGSEMTAAGLAWTGVEQIIGGARSVDGLRHHGVELIAAHMWRRQGRLVPAELRADERLAAIKTL